MAAAALVPVLVPVIAPIVAPTTASIWAPDVIGSTVVFTAMWLVSAWLFHKAGERTRAAP